MILPTKEFLKIFKQTEGALSVCESIAIMNIACQAPRGLWMELGTHKGKSAMSASVGGNHRDDFILCDPIFEDKELVSQVFISIKKALQYKGLPFYIASNSISIHEITCQTSYAYVFVDSGSHQDGLPMMEVKLLEDRIIQGGIIAFHDYNSQFYEVTEAYNYLVSTGKYEEIEINWDEIIEYVKENDLEKGNNSWHHTELEFPCFVGALKRK